MSTGSYESSLGASGEGVFQGCPRHKTTSHCRGYPRKSLNVRFHLVFVKKCAIMSTM